MDTTPVAAVRTPSAVPRRVLVAALLVPVVWVTLSSAGGGTGSAPIGWAILVSLASVLGSISLATFVPGPGAGWKPVWGCGPCSIVALTSVPAAAIMLHGSPGVTTTAVIAALVTGLGVLQRLRDPKTCPTTR